MISTTVKLKDDYTSTASKIIGSAKEMDKAIDKSSSVYSRMSSKVSSAMAKTKSAVNSAREAIKKPFKMAMDNKIFKTISKIKSKIGELGKKLTKFASKPFNISLKLAKSGFSALKTIGGAVAGLGASTGAGLLGMAKMGSDLEQQKISMTHFLGGDKKASSDYLKQLRDNANATPFETGEVVQAGTRAVQIAEGDTTKGMEFVKLAEDMAALNPGKTISDAMEALADANMGEMERLKEFGFKGSKEEFDNANGDLFKMKSNSGKTLQEMYQGGAGKLAGSAKGKLSTFTGKVKSGLQDAGLKVIDKLAPALDRLIPIADVLSETIMSLTDKALVYFEDLFSQFGNIGKDLMPILQDVFGAIKPIVMDILNGVGPFIKGTIDMIKPVLEQIAPILTAVWSALGVLVQPLVNLGSTLMPIFASALSYIAPIVNGIVTPAFEMIGSFINNFVVPCLNALWSAIEPVLTPAIEILSAAFEAISPVVDVVTSVLGKLGEVIGGAISKISGLVGKAWSGIKSVGKAIYNGFTQSGAGPNDPDNYATGTSFAIGGLARINERGEELIDLPRGARVYPSGKTNQMLSQELNQNTNGGNTYNLTVNVTTGGNIDENRIGQILLNQFKKFEPQRG